MPKHWSIKRDIEGVDIDGVGIDGVEDIDGVDIDGQASVREGALLKRPFSYRCFSINDRE